jgi:hypothetical protein
MKAALAADGVGEPLQRFFEIGFLGVLPNLLPPAFAGGSQRHRPPLLPARSVNKLDGFPTLCRFEFFRFTLGPVFGNVRDARKSITSELEVEAPNWGTRCAGRRT